MKICILGNSVALRVRPPRKGPQECTYAEWLERDGYQVRVVARAGTLLDETFAMLDDDVVTAFPDYVIVNYGVVETCFRQTVRWLNNKTITNYYRNSVFRRPYVFSSPAERGRLLCWRLLNGAVRRAAFLLRLKWPWMSLPRFLEVLDASMAVILKETGAHIILVAINPCSPRVERILAGSSEAINAANRAMLGLADRHGGRVTFIPSEEFLPLDRLDELVPDGIHFSAEGHRLMAAALRRRLPPPFAGHS